jgi:hypothetical protein
MVHVLQPFNITMVSSEQVTPTPSGVNILHNGHDIGSAENDVHRWSALVQSSSHTLDVVVPRWAGKEVTLACSGSFFCRPKYILEIIQEIGMAVH